ncbi:acyltransferase family protein [uncultured Tateyamaria sp.]|uniref:acyltransferase family protein n=1 Tax=Tateyamaria sp. 1078 TaxID=3417464 RepID=UPI0026294EBE|nr:acyltransferase family protein [uncultured Tateyamaria sp.]
MTHAPVTYRPEIDGMRAIAVGAVIVYHLKIDWGGDSPLMAGGFLGVDLFFVLSGFLITGILVDEFRSTGRISIAQFYWRRARRILPPLLLVMLASLPAAWALLLPSELERFSLSLVAALAFVSNIFWFFELSEYGAQSGLLQPFLHTWSLAIEEQFYLIFPPLLILLLRHFTLSRVMWIVAALTGIGLVVAAITTVLHPAFSFYAPTSRAWEMLAGALLAVISRHHAARGQGGLFRFVPAVSLVVLLWAFFSQDLVEMRHPGIDTLPVILATCGLIWCADPREPVTRLLSTGPMVWIGKLSYSLYLWHFPVFAFGRVMSVGAPGPLEMALWLAMTLALSVAGYHLVEKPFRFRVGPRPFAAATLAAVLPVAGITALSLSDMGASSGRAQALAELYGPNEIDNSVLAQASWGLIDARFPEEDIGPWNAQRPSVSGTTKLWFEGADTRKVLIVGDSLSKDVYNALTLNAERFPNYEFARFNLHRKSLDEDLVTLVGTPNFAAADVIMIAPNYYREYRRALTAMLESVGGQGKDVIVLGNTAKFNAGGAQPLFDWFLIKSGDRAALENLNALAPKYEDDRSRVQNTVIRDIAEAAGAQYLSRRDLVCQSDISCTLITQDGLKTMYDGLHWSLAGAALFGSRAADAGWLAAPSPIETGG